LGIKPRSVLAMIDRERHRRENGEDEANSQESAGISAKTPEGE
jgi:hypothetical protein